MHFRTSQMSVGKVSMICSSDILAQASSLRFAFPCIAGYGFHSGMVLARRLISSYRGLYETGWYLYSGGSARVFHPSSRMLQTNYSFIKLFYLFGISLSIAPNSRKPFGEKMWVTQKNI
jgi:hypothetical protein